MVVNRTEYDIAVERLLHSDRFLYWRPDQDTDDSSTSLGNEIDLQTSFEKHYSAAEVSSLWGISVDLVRDIFRDKPGVLRIRRPATKMKRGYSTLRIPESVLNEVYSELSQSRVK